MLATASKTSVETALGPLDDKERSTRTISGMADDTKTGVSRPRLMLFSRLSELYKSVGVRAREEGSERRRSERGVFC